MSAADALETAAEIVALFAGPLAAGEAPSSEAVAVAVDVALDASAAALPDVLDIDGVSVPAGVLVDALLRPALEYGIAALIAATRPVRLIVNDPSSVRGTIHD